MQHAAVLAISLVLSAPVSAQFDHLVTNDEGDVLYFSSPLRMSGQLQFDYRKLFVADAHGIRLYMQVERRQINVPESGWPVSTYYSIEAASLNGDGSVVGIIARRDCYGGSGCLPVPKFRTEIAGSQFRGRMSLSRNGRFALLLGDGAMISTGALVDLSSGQRLEWMDNGYAQPRYGRRRVTSGGSALLAAPTELRLVRLDGSTSVPVPDMPLEAIIDDEGKAAVYETGQKGSVEHKLVYVELGSGAVRVLATSAAPMQPCLSNDGQVVLFLSTTEPAGSGQVFVTGADGAGRRQLTQDPSGITEIVLSGNGKVAYAVSAAGRVFRIDVASGATDEIIGRSVSMVAPSSSVAPYPVPGSAFSISGRGFADSADSAAPPLPLDLNGLELLLDGLPLPLQTVTPTKIVFQLPWDTTLGKHRLEARTGAAAIFETEPIELEILHEAFAQFELLGEQFRPSVSGSPYALAAHSDFSGPVTAENRARAGEVIHLYMTGLGPVEPAVTLGAPSPSDPPARLRLPLSCHFAPKDVFDQERPAEILFVGLAPGFAGYYQLTVRIPEEVSIMYGDALLGCAFPNPGSGWSAWIPMAEQ